MTLRGHAVVLGAGMAGLLAARVLSEFYTTVTVVERDQLPANPLQRKGIPQGRHLHSLLSRGTHELERLFPGLLDELIAAGAGVLDDGDLSRVYTRFGHYVLNREQKFTDPATLKIYLASRPFVEFHIRRRVGGLGNVRFLDGHDVIEPVAATPQRVIGVRVIDRATGDETVLDTELVVDAMGRSARTPAFLEHLGCGRPPERHSTARATYTSQLLRIPDGMFAEKLVLVNGRSPRGGLAAYEDGTWILTVGQAAIDPDPPTDLAGMLSLAGRFAPPAVMRGLRSAEPIGDAVVFRYTGAVWRRYDHMGRLPDGLLVIGDALCSLNPIYGQGMTMAALEALVLQEYLRGTDMTPQLFYRAAAAHIGPIWAMNHANDHPAVDVCGRPSISRRLRNWSVEKAMQAAEHDIVLSERLFRVAQLVDPPGRLQHPALLGRVVLGNLRRGRHRQPDATTPAEFHGATSDADL
jgi:2-polyprenyl-6-methoxyphenol hydroxylase-like FAD-dependent oxidoreductase